LGADANDPGTDVFQQPVADVVTVNFQERPRSSDEAAPAVSGSGKSKLGVSPKPAVPSGPTTPETWAKLFQSDRPQAELVRQLTTELSQARRHNDVIALLEQAILAGQSQPWMYEVLALTMELAGRPRAQIERVLLSSRDVTPADVDSLLFLAAYLARFERYGPALQCCRQAAELEPNRPEPYVEGLRFAERAKDRSGQAWAALGVLTYYWGPDRAARQQAAEAAAADARAAWEKAGDFARVMEFDRALREARRRDLQIRLEFSGAGDLDLLVEEPSGETCSRDRPYTRGGGVLAHDGYGPQPENAYDEYVCPMAWNGEYVVRIRYVWGQIVGKRARLIIIRAAGTDQEQREVLSIAVASEDQIVRISLKNGRRQTAAAFLPLRREDQPQTPVQQTVFEQLAPAQFAAGQVAPFTGGVQPIGGGVGYQPVVQFIPSGVSLTATATVSADRRYVRISTQPFFSEITNVFTFSFISGGAGGVGGGGGVIGGGGVGGGPVGGGVGGGLP
jgi:tetratricopeptide (TPR) repeat protein